MVKASEIVNEFDSIHCITDIILLGADGAVRRIEIETYDDDDAGEI